MYMFKSCRPYPLLHPYWVCIRMYCFILFTPISVYTSIRTSLYFFLSLLNQLHSFVPIYVYGACRYIVHIYIYTYFVTEVQTLACIPKTFTWRIIPVSKWFMTIASSCPLNRATFPFQIAKMTYTWGLTVIFFPVSSRITNGLELG